MGLYSTKIHDIADLGQNNTIAIPNDPTNGGRALILLHNKGLITLKDPSNLASTEADIIDNPKDLKIVSVEAALLPRIIKEYDAAVINSNFAIPAGFTSKDALIIEDRSSPYINVLVLKANNVDNPHILTLKKVLQSPKVKEFIEQTYNGELVPVF